MKKVIGPVGVGYNVRECVKKRKAADRKKRGGEAADWSVSIGSSPKKDRGGL